MNVRKWVKAWCNKHLYLKREPDLYVGGREKPYLLRWYVIPRNPIFNIYFHIFQRSDYAEALHDHPWLFNASLLLDGSYTEVVPGPDFTNTRNLERKEGSWYFRWGKAPHRVQLHAVTQNQSVSTYGQEDPCSTLFITGPKVRKWGFYCPKGWKPWYKFLDKYESAHESVETNGCD